MKVEFYVDMTTGEVLENHSSAMAHYRAGNNIQLWAYRAALDDTVPVLTWEH